MTHIILCFKMFNNGTSKGASTYAANFYQMLTGSHNDVPITRHFTSVNQNFGSA